MAEFKGLKQVTLSTYLETSEEIRKDYLWFVRELSGETVLSSAIYFGNRKYADIGGEVAEEKAQHLIASLGGMVDENGEWVGFLPIEEHEILSNSGITTVEDALTALESAILENARTIAEKDGELNALKEEVEDLDDRATITANTYSDAAEMENLPLGKIIYVMNEEEVSGITYGSGAYINTQAGLKKLDSTAPSSSTTIEDRVETLENAMGLVDAEIGDTEYEGDSITAAIADLQSRFTISGDDVEE